MLFLSRSAYLLLAVAAGACSSATAPSSPNAPPVPPGPPPPPSAGVQGTFVGVGHTGKGTVQFTVQSGVGRLDFSADFQVTPVPGPYVYLTTTTSPNSGSPLRVAALKSNTGAQTYSFQLPAGVSYTYILVWCDPNNVPVAEAMIPPLP